MRTNIVHPGAEELVYEIRAIVAFAQAIEKTGIRITWENIGDPIAKGEQVPQWIREIIAEEVLHNNDSYGYSPTKGLEEARQFLASTRSQETGNMLTPDDIIFFNGLGDAIHEIYIWLHANARVLGPNPAYPTHSSIEGAHAHSQQQTYKLLPENNWLPDVQDISDKVKNNPDIAGLLIINPDNPTGMVYPKEILEEFIKIAEEHDLFLVADEIYANLAFDQTNYYSLASLAKRVPTMIMRGLSKEVPWPGSRCGWVEFYNSGEDAGYAAYIQSIEAAKMNEVCSTTLPQTVLPKILADERYQPHLNARKQKYQKRADQASDILNSNEYLEVVKAKGAFYLSVTFNKTPPSLKMTNEPAEVLLKQEIMKEPDMMADKKFCLELLASTGICVVPLSSGFNSHVQGFRMTLLEENDEVFLKTLQTITSALDNS